MNRVSRLRMSATPMIHRSPFADMADFVGQHAGQLAAGQTVQQSGRDADRGVIAPPGGKGVHHVARDHIDLWLGFQLCAPRQRIDDPHDLTAFCGGTRRALYMRMIASGATRGPRRRISATETKVQITPAPPNRSTRTSAVRAAIPPTRTKECAVPELRRRFLFEQGKYATSSALHQHMRDTVMTLR